MSEEVGCLEGGGGGKYLPSRGNCFSESIQKNLTELPPIKIDIERERERERVTIISRCSVYKPHKRKGLYLVNANNKDPDQTVVIYSLIRNFAILRYIL